MSQISVIICSHKAPPSLRECLRSLASQSEKKGLEVILVNNGFSEAAESILFKEVAGWNAGFAFRICHEARPGLGYARSRGFEEGTGQWFVLLDDDNTLEPDFIQRLCALTQAHSGLGGITAAVTPVWEQMPPAWLQNFGTLCLSYNLPERPAGTTGDTRYEPSQFPQAPRPPGGGMVVHGKVVDAYLAAAKDSIRLSLARTGESLVGCEDQDLWNQIGSLGMAVLQTNELKVLHHIPASRLKLGYLSRLNFQMQYSYRLLQRLDASKAAHAQPRPGLKAIFKALAQSGRLLKIAATHPREHPWQKQLLLVACEWGRLAGDLEELENHAS